MEGIIDYWAFWAAYIAAGLIGLWCWGKLIFWVKTPGLFHHLFSALGAILIFTPAPINEHMGQQLAPAIFPLVFNFASEGVAGIGYLAIWYGISSVLAFAIVWMAYFAGWMSTPTASSRASSSDASSSTKKGKH